jgi:hypothetical protein
LSTPSKSGSKNCDRSRWSASESSSDKSPTPPRFPIHVSLTKRIVDLPPPPLVKASSFEESQGHQSLKNKRRSDTCKCAPFPIDTQLVNNSHRRSSQELIGEAIDVTLNLVASEPSSSSPRSILSQERRMLSADAACQERCETPQLDL